MKETGTRGAADLLSLPPAAKMELADRLYDLAVQELEGGAEWPAAKPGAADHAPWVDPGPCIEPWQGFAERLRQR